MTFSKADSPERLHAIGSLEGLPPQLRRAFSVGDDFDPIPNPGPTDWLSVARERGQRFDQFTRVASRWLAGAPETPHCLYLRPVGDFPGRHAELLRQLQQFGSAFFARDVRFLPALDVKGHRITTRQNRFTDVLQLRTRDILPALARDIPADAVCVLGVTAYDLYPHDTWSFVFGEALLGERVGVFSIARYDPAFYDTSAEDRSLLLRRSCKVLAHETGHMLGIQHCVFFNCLMNGSNHLAESDRRPLHLCPVDLRKLQWTFGLDVVERYRHLLAFWRQAGVEDEAAWIGRRLDFIERG